MDAVQVPWRGCNAQSLKMGPRSSYVSPYVVRILVGACGFLLIDFGGVSGVEGGEGEFALLCTMGHTFFLR